MRHALILSVLVAAVAVPVGARAQEIHGALIAAETATPLPYGTVQLLDSNLAPVATAYTDELGRFALVAPGPGRYSLLGSHLTAQPLISAPMDLAAGQVAIVELTLALQPIELDSLLVSVRPEYRALVRDGFYQRAKSGAGRFIAPDQIEKWRPFRSTDLLRRIPGVRLTADPNEIDRYRITMSRSGMVTGALSDGGGRRCEPKIIIDDVEMYDFNVDDLPAQDLLAVEVYTSPINVPARYGGLGSCGAVVIWTGHRPSSGG